MYAVLCSIYNQYTWIYRGNYHSKLWPMTPKSTGRFLPKYVRAKLHPFLCAPACTPVLACASIWIHGDVEQAIFNSQKWLTWKKEKRRIIKVGKNSLHRNQNRLFYIWVISFKKGSWNLRLHTTFCTCMYMSFVSEERFMGFIGFPKGSTIQKAQKQSFRKLKKNISFLRIWWFTPSTMMTK